MIHFLIMTQSWSFFMHLNFSDIKTNEIRLWAAEV